MLFVYIALCESLSRDTNIHIPKPLYKSPNKFYSYSLHHQIQHPPKPLVPYRYENSYEFDSDGIIDNGLGKKLKKAVKKVTKVVTKPVEKITKPVEKVVKKTVQTVSKVIYDKKSNEWSEPIKITSIQKFSESKDYSTTDLSSLINTIISDFSIDRNKLTNFFNKAKFTNQAKTLINMVDFNAKSDKRYRLGNLGVAGLKVTKSGSSYTVNVKKASANSEIWANTVKKSTKKIVGISSSSKSASWRPLTASELTQVFQTLQSSISSEIATIKKI